MTYSDDGIYVPSEHGGTPVTVIRKSKRQYAGYSVRGWTGHRSVSPVTVTRKGKGAIRRLCHTSMEAIPYGHRRNTEREGGIHRLCSTSMEARPYSHKRNTERERGPYTGYAVRSWKQYPMVIEAIPYEDTGNIVQA